VTPTQSPGSMGLLVRAASSCRVALVKVATQVRNVRSRGASARKAVEAVPASTPTQTDNVLRHCNASGPFPGSADDLMFGYEDENGVRHPLV